MTKDKLEKTDKDSSVKNVNDFNFSQMKESAIELKTQYNPESVANDKGKHFVYKQYNKVLDKAIEFIDLPDSKKQGYLNFVHFLNYKFPQDIQEEHQSYLKNKKKFLLQTSICIFLGMSIYFAVIMLKLPAFLLGATLIPIIYFFYIFYKTRNSFNILLMPHDVKTNEFDVVQKYLLKDFLRSNITNLQMYWIGAIISKIIAIDGFSDKENFKKRLEEEIQIRNNWSINSKKLWKFQVYNSFHWRRLQKETIEI